MVHAAKAEVEAKAKARALEVKAGADPSMELFLRSESTEKFTPLC